MDVDPLQIVSSTADPAFATDERGRVVIWNRGVEALLGCSASDALGRPCHEVVRGLDVFGNVFCHEHCSLHHMVCDHEAIASFEIDVVRDGGARRRVNVSVIAVPGPRESQYSLIHLLRPVTSDAGDEALPRQPHPGELPSRPPPPAAQGLTPREIEILVVLAEGWSTQQIADRLFISVATVRNHVQSILQKLEVHSRVEAVSLALRERLI